jgi:predicted ATPase/DNA-binding winged helix-turn-helix (wHTH) protein
MNASTAPQEERFAFGPYRFVPSRQTLFRGQQPIKLGGRALDILHKLLLHAGEPVLRDALVGHAWPNTFVGESNLRVHIRKLRRALGETHNTPSYIATIAGRGYRFVASVAIERGETNDVLLQGQRARTTLPRRRKVIGRAADLDRIGGSLNAAQLTTVVGPGGVGKTTVAIEIAHQREHQFEEGICFVDARDTEDFTLVPHVVAHALGLRISPGDIESAIISYLRQRRLLLILDNCDHVIDAIAMLSHKILASAPRATLLATCRSPIRAHGENVIRIDPLTLPREELEGVQALRHPAVELFKTRAEEMSGYQLQCTDAGAIARLCRAVDGLPLAIELAAKNISQTTPGEILQSIMPAVPSDTDHEQTGMCLWRTIDWSYALLKPEEAKYFKLLSIFAAEFEFTDAVELALRAGYDLHQATAIVATLVSNSLLAVKSDGGILWYRLWECTRKYARLRLIEDTRLYHLAQLDHATLVLALFDRAEREWNWIDIDRWRSRFARRNGDLRQALDVCFAGPGEPVVGVQLACLAIRLWEGESSIQEQCTQVRRALECSSRAVNNPDALARLSLAHAWTMTLGREMGADVDALWQHALVLANSCVDSLAKFTALTAYSIVLIYQGRPAQALETVTACISMAEEESDHSSMMDGQSRHALALMQLGKLLPARRVLETLARAFTRGRAPSGIVHCKSERYIGVNTTLAFLLLLTGQPGEASALAEEMLKRAEREGHLLGQSHVLALVSLPLALWNGDRRSLNQSIEILKRIIESANIAMWRPVLHFYEAAGAHVGGDPCALRAMERSIQDMVTNGLLMRTPWYFAVLAESTLEVGEADRAQAFIERALLQQSRCQELWSAPELMRIEGRVASALGHHRRASELLRESWSAAEGIGARFFQLRIADTLACRASAADDTLESAEKRLRATRVDHCGVEGLLIAKPDLVGRVRANASATEAPAQRWYGGQSIGCPDWSGRSGPVLIAHDN